MNRTVANVQTFTSLGDAMTNAMSQADRPLSQKGGTAHTIYDLAELNIRARCRILQVGAEDVERTIKQSRDNFEKGLTLCESPIECMTLAALMTADWWKCGAFCPSVHDVKRGRRFPPGDLVIVPQMPFARVRMDFALVGRTGKSLKIIDVECDGAEFHDPVSDRRRDDYLASWDIKTFRISGADINADVARAVVSVADEMTQWRESL